MMSQVAKPPRDLCRERCPVRSTDAFRRGFSRGHLSENPDDAYFAAFFRFVWSEDGIDYFQSWLDETYWASRSDSAL